MEHFPLMTAFKTSFVWCPSRCTHVSFSSWCSLAWWKLYLSGLRGWWCSAPTAGPPGALIKVKEAKLICMADGARTTLHDALSVKLEKPETIERERELNKILHTVVHRACSNFHPLNTHPVSLQIMHFFCWHCMEDSWVERRGWKTRRMRLDRQCRRDGLVIVRWRRDRCVFWIGRARGDQQ